MIACPFVGKKRDGEASAVLSILMSPLGRHSVDPRVYLTQLLVDLATVGDDRKVTAEWLRDRWKRRESKRAARRGTVEPTRKNVSLLHVHRRR